MIGQSGRSGATGDLRELLLNCQAGKSRLDLSERVHEGRGRSGGWPKGRRWLVAAIEVRAIGPARTVDLIHVDHVRLPFAFQSGAIAVWRRPASG